MIIKKNVVFILTLLFFCSLVFAQETTGEINGNVCLEDGAVLPGVTVFIQGKTLVGKKVLISDDSGSYKAPMLPPGEYKLTFTLEGFKTVIRDKINLEVGKVLKLNIVMAIGEVEETIEVVGGTPLVDIRQSATASNITKETFTKLPTGRNFTSVMSNQGGINYEGYGYYFNGASESENTFFVDGTNTTSLFSGLSVQSINTDGVEEVQLKSAGYSAEYGGSMGGVISVITKSGGNEFHGDVSLYYDADWLDVKNKAPLMRDPFDRTKVLFDEGRLKDKYYRIEPSFSLGGFLIKDKVWFFANFAPVFSKTTRTARFFYYPEHDGEKFDSEYKSYKGSFKVATAITNKLRLSLSGTLDIGRYDRSLPLITGKSSYKPEEWAVYAKKYPGLSLSGNLDWSIGNDLFVNVQGGYFRNNSYECGPDQMENPPIRVLFSNSNAHLNPGADLVRPGSWSNYSYNNLNKDDRNLAERIQAKTDFTYYFSAGGDHIIKGGFGWSKQKLDLISGTANEYWKFYWKNERRGIYEKFTATYGGKVYPTTYGFVRTYQNGILGKTENDVLSFYIQDSWVIGKSLTINYGIRMEREKMPSFDKRFDYAFKFDFFDKLAPRIGFAWDINGDGKNKLFGSFGTYYDVMKLKMAMETFGGSTYWLGYYDLATLDWTKYLDTLGPVWDKDPRYPADQTDPIHGGRLFEFRNLREISNPSEQVQPDIKPFSKMEMSLGYSRMLGKNISFSVTGIYNKVLNAIEDIGIQHEKGESYFVGNPGSDWIRKQFDPATNPQVPHDYKAPKAIRKYRSLKFELEKKFADNWFGGISLTLSKLRGNFSGLASSDLVTVSPMVNRFFDVWFLHMTQDLKSNEGILPTDRPVDIRVYGAYSFDFGLTIGVNAYLKSGTPTTRYVSVNEYSGYTPVGRGTLGRTPTVWKINSHIEQTFKLGDRIKMSVHANIYNLTNNHIATYVGESQNDERVGISNEELKNGYNMDDVLQRLGTNISPFYRKKYSFQSSISARLGFKLSF